ncbi:Uncharacterised protein [Chlamydia trachomatis]|nr:hypothetical protein DU13_0891 [Chlamydia trachomatis]CCP55701.1 hypothetical protein SOTONE4_00885 [Chlamydia trachomatis E/SotonE4]CCP56598.1 hypothetical protein SOTONE8_00889 [Chlamydia trachomatis E/SotonE8]ROT51118.1 hypothetical protein DU15_0891 [Chlamydia trachomatis]ROT53561.1 hypothetical protein DU12_0887 [Chlamydia trachomatis]
MRKATPAPTPNLTTLTVVIGEVTSLFHFNKRATRYYEKIKKNSWVNTFTSNLKI